MARVAEENVHNLIHEQHAVYMRLCINARISSRWVWENVRIDVCADEALHPVNVSFFTCSVCLF